MPIAVNLVAGPDAPESRSAVLPDAGGVIGRHPGCEFPLPDKRKHVSLRHAFVERVGDRLFVTDLSTNGTFQPDQADPIGRGQTVELKDGARILCARYAVELRLADEAPAQAPPARSAAPADASGDSLLDGLLEGLGIERDALDLSDPHALGHRVGESLRHALATVALALRMRAHVKGSVRADVTQMLPSQSNPLKLSLNEIDALEALLGPAHAHFMDAPSALREVQTDLRNHELAVLDAVRLSLKSVLDTLAPATLAEAAEQPPHASLWRSSAQQRWLALNAAHAELAGDDRELDRRFGQIYNRLIGELDRSSGDS